MDYDRSKCSRKKRQEFIDTLNQCMKNYEIDIEGRMKSADEAELSELYRDFKKSKFKEIKKHNELILRQRNKTNDVECR